MKKNKFSRWHFLGLVVILYIIIFLISPNKSLEILKQFLSIFKSIIIALFTVFFLMILTNYFLDQKKLAKYLGKESGWRGFIIAILGGILTTGPIYIWFPLLKELKEKGAKNSLITVFLYNRAVKIMFLPFLIIYFGAKYTIILTITMIIASIIQGILLEKFIDKNKQ